MAFQTDTSNTIVLKHDFRQPVPVVASGILLHENGTPNNRFNASRAEIFNEYERNLRDIVQRLGDVETNFTDNENNIVTVGSKIRLMNSQIANFLYSNVTIENISDIIGKGIIPNNNGSLNCNITGDAESGYTINILPGYGIADTFFYRQTSNSEISDLSTPSIYLHHVGDYNNEAHLSSYEEINKNTLVASGSYYILTKPYLATGYSFDNKSIYVETFDSSDELTADIYSDGTSEVIISDSKDGVIHLSSSLFVDNDNIAIAYKQHTGVEFLISAQEDEDNPGQYILLVETEQHIPNSSTISFKYNSRDDFYIKHRTSIITDSIPLYIIHLDPSYGYIINGDGKSFVFMDYNNVIDIRGKTLSNFDVNNGLNSSLIALADDGFSKVRLEARNVSGIDYGSTTNIDKIEVTTDDFSVILKDTEISENSLISQKPIVISYFCEDPLLPIAAHQLTITYDTKQIICNIPELYFHSNISRQHVVPTIDGSTYFNTDLTILARGGDSYIINSQTNAGTGIKSHHIQNGAITDDKLAYQIHKQYVSVSGNSTNYIDVPFRLDDNCSILFENQGPFPFDSNIISYNHIGQNRLEFMIRAADAITFNLNICVIKNNPYFSNIIKFTNSSVVNIGPTDKYVYYSLETSYYNKIYNFENLASNIIIDHNPENIEFNDEIYESLIFTKIDNDSIYKSQLINTNDNVSLNGLLPVENKSDFINKTVILFTDSNGVVTFPIVTVDDINISVSNANGLTAHTIKTPE